MSFAEKITLLQQLYRSQHDLTNHIDGASFSEEKGQLTEEELKSLEEKKSQYDVLTKEEETLRENIRQEYPEEYARYLKDIQTKLQTIQKHLAKPEKLEFKDSFNKTLCDSLLSDLSKLILNKKPKYALNWLFDVSLSLIEEYRGKLKL